MFIGRKHIKGKLLNTMEVPHGKNNSFMDWENCLDSMWII